LLARIMQLGSISIDGPGRATRFHLQHRAPAGVRAGFKLALETESDDWAQD
jgi:hypothetical protein